MANVINFVSDGKNVQLSQAQLIGITQGKGDTERTNDTTGDARIVVTYQDNKSFVKSLIVDIDDTVTTVGSLSDNVNDAVPLIVVPNPISDVLNKGYVPAGGAVSTTTITLGTDASSVNSFYVGKYIVITEGTGIGQVRKITAYVGSTRLATVATWTAPVAETSYYKVMSNSGAFLDGGKAVSATGTTIVLNSTSSTVDDFYKGMFIKIVGGLGKGQIRRINAYTGSSTKEVALITGDDWATTPDSTSNYVIVQSANLVNTKRAVILNIDDNTISYNAEKNDNVKVVVSGVDIYYATELIQNVADNDYVTVTGSQTITGAKTFSATIAAGGAVTVASTTDASSKDSGAIIVEGGIGVEKAIFAGTTVTATVAVVTNTIAEKTAANGVGVDGVLLKDSTIALLDGTVSNLSVKIGADANNGIYGVSDTQLGIAVEGALVAGANTAGLFTGAIAEQVATAGVSVDGAVLKDGSLITVPTAVAENASDTLTSEQMLAGVITSTSVGAVALTTPAVTSILELISGGGIGTQFDLAIDNSQGASTVTLTLDASITAPVGAVTGGNNLAVTTTHKVGIFRFYITSSSTAVVYRIA